MARNAKNHIKQPSLFAAYLDVLAWVEANGATIAYDATRSRWRVSVLVQTGTYNSSYFEAYGNSPGHAIEQILVKKTDIYQS